MPKNSELITVFLLLSGKFFGRGGSDDGAGFKAALLSGPPGIGKTTTATLVCKVGYYTPAKGLRRYFHDVYVLMGQGSRQLFYLREFARQQRLHLY